MTERKPQAFTVKEKMMKKYLSMIMCFLLVGMLLSGCVNQGTETAGKQQEKQSNQKDLSEPEEASAELDADYLNIDIDVLYHYLDGDKDFLLMKLGELPLVDEEGGKYYELDNDSYSTLYWLAEDDYTIKRISVIQKDKDAAMDEDPEAGEKGTPIRLMGIWFGMTMEEAAKNVTNIPEWGSEAFDLSVKYFDNGDNLVHRIEIYSNKSNVKNEAEEAFYLKWLGSNIEEEADHLGFGPFDTTTPAIDTTNKIYSYKQVRGPDKWHKLYYYNDNKAIIGMKITTDSDNPFKATVPSLLGVKLNSISDKIKSALESGNNIVNSEESYASEEGFTIREYIVTNNEAHIDYKVKVDVRNSNNMVKNVFAEAFE